MAETVLNLALSVALPEEDRRKIGALVLELAQLRAAARAVLDTSPFDREWNEAHNRLWAVLNRIETAESQV